MLDLVQLKTFIVVATTKNFTVAAAQLGYSQSTVTYHIKTLERELGVRLLSRFQFAHSIDLTAVGRRILTYATQLLVLAEETKAAAKQTPRQSNVHSVSRAARKKDPSLRKHLLQSTAACHPVPCPPLNDN